MLVFVFVFFASAPFTSCYTFGPASKVVARPLHPASMSERRLRQVRITVDSSVLFHALNLPMFACCMFSLFGTVSVGIIRTILLPTLGEGTCLVMTRCPLTFHWQGVSCIRTKIVRVCVIQCVCLLLSGIVRFALGVSHMRLHASWLSMNHDSKCVSSSFRNSTCRNIIAPAVPNFAYIRVILSVLHWHTYTLALFAYTALLHGIYRIFHYVSIVCILLLHVHHRTQLFIVTHWFFNGIAFF